ncbi:IS701 family transposase [Amycolatopsis xylanica]|uniref:IS701 family transposase n=1 Tax=Amycolatopsis xylanica TaxID=589385 RepID=UPI0015A1A5A8|nr:transposase [Amycolatopsis xylanica]
MVYDRIAPNFTRAEPRRRAWTYLLDLPSAYSAGLRGGDNVGHYEGERRADGAQRLLTSAQWDESVVRDELRTIAVQHGGHTGGSFYVTEVAFPKKGRSAVAVERQYSNDTKKAENCQIGLVLFYVTMDGLAFLIDRELYLPKSWADDASRRRRARIPAHVTYRSKSTIAATMINRALKVNIRPEWVAISLVCTEKAQLHHLLRQKQLQHIITSTAGELHTGSFGTPFTTPHTTLRLKASPPGHEVYTYHRDALHRFAAEPAEATKFDTAFLVTATAGHYAKPRSYFLAHTRRHTSLADVAPIVFLMESAGAYCRLAKEDIGLGHYEVRSWRGWYRHITLAAAAHTALELAKSHSRRAALAG